jgi:hypothetical protein
MSFFRERLLTFWSFPVLIFLSGCTKPECDSFETRNAVLPRPIREAVIDECPLMTDEPLSLQGRQQAALAMRRRLVITLVAAGVLIGGGWITLWAAGGNSAVATAPHAPTASAGGRRPSDELLETTKGLQVTQQRAVDQLQVAQDQLVAQMAETKRLSEQIATLTERLDALQRSVANMPATTHAAGSPSGPQPKAH